LIIFRFNPAKAGGWLLLLGVGGLLCYRLASERWPAPLSVLAGDVAASLLLWKRRRSSLHLDADAAQDAAVVDGQLVEVRRRHLFFWNRMTLATVPRPSVPLLEKENSDI